MDRLIVGIITMPFSLSSKERLLWLQGWIKNCAKGMKHDTLTVDVCFTYGEDMDASMKYLMQPGSGLTMMHDGDFITDYGVYVRLFYSEESEEFIKQYRND